jgi:hypothetical protein
MNRVRPTSLCNIWQPEVLSVMGPLAVPWASGGGIWEVGTPHSPGFKVVATPEMTAPWGGKQAWVDGILMGITPATRSSRVPARRCRSAMQFGFYSANRLTSEVQFSTVQADVTPQPMSYATEGSGGQPVSLLTVGEPSRTGINREFWV